MLPDYPEIKRHLHRQLMTQFEALVATKAPLAAQLRRIRQHEGDRFIFEDDEGHVTEKRHLTFQAPVQLPLRKPISETSLAVTEQLERAAESIAAQSEGLLFTAVQEAVESVGNAYDARGKEFHPNMMWDMLESIHVDFDKHGEPELPTIVLHPDMLAAIRHKLPEWEADPDLKKRRTEVLQRKKEEWRDRESHRKLVG
jgi:hypothetical protein